MNEKSINDWHNTDSINWENYWELIDTLDSAIKKNRNTKRKSRGGWRWPAPYYNATNIFQERFHTNGQVKISYRGIAQDICPSISNGDKFVSGIIRSMLRMMNHPLKRRKWDLNMVK